ASTNASAKPSAAPSGPGKTDADMRGDTKSAGSPGDKKADQNAAQPGNPKAQGQAAKHRP
ncbi:MAG TPA: flagellar hook-length control protein FliK, partial [Actinomycetota bacterium]|nr:flagellar hook-length control protein FliK [Actinomycetota bacterium]